MTDNSWGVILLESGMPRLIPGLFDNTPALSFPFWGGYTFLEFILHFWGKTPGLIMDSRFAREAVRLAPLLREKGIKPRLLEEENSFSDIANIIEEYPFKTVIFVHTAVLAWWPSPEHLPGENSKYAVNNTPLPVYSYSRRDLLDHLNSGEPLQGVNDLVHGVLDRHFEKLHDPGGKIFFYNQLMEYYHNNLWLIEHFSSPPAREFLETAGEVTKKEGVIGETGEVISSIIMPGTVIHGRVENSFIFKGVEVGRDTIIKDSVIMNGCRIAPGCRIEKALVLPENDDPLIIKEGTVIGKGSGTGKNELYGEQINEGISLIGSNTVIPPGVEAGRGCYISPGLKEKDFEGISRLPPYNSFMGK